MLGCNNSVLTRMKKTVPNLWHQWCICHCLNLVASKAQDTLKESESKLLNITEKEISENLEIDTYSDVDD